MTDWLRRLRRPDLLIALALLFLAALAVGPGMLPGRTPLPLDILGLFEPWRLEWPAAANPEVGDAVLQFSSRVFMAESLKSGHLPLWNPTVMAGHPHAGDTHSSPFYLPLLLLSWCCHPLTAYKLQLLLQMWLAGVFMFLWMRALHLARLPAAAAAIAWMLAGVQQIWLPFPPFPGTLCWLTAIPAAWEVARRTGSRRAMAGGALATGLAITAGQLQFFLYGGLLLGLYGLLRLAASPPEQRRRGVWAGVAIAGLGLALGAVHVLPTYAVALDTIRPPFTWEALRQTGLPWHQLVTLVAPWFMGHPGRGDYRGAQNASELMAYVGLLPLLAALTAWWIRRDRLTALFSGLALLVMAIALATPLAWPLAQTPWLQRFGLMRWLALWPLVVAPLLALVLDAVASGAAATGAIASVGVASAGAASAGPESAGRPAVTATARRLRVLPLAAALLAALLLLSVRLDPKGAAEMTAALGWLVASALALMLWVRRPRSAPRSALLLVVLAADLLVMGRGYVPSAPTSDYFPPLAPLDRLLAERARDPFRIVAFQSGVIALGPSVPPSLGLDEIGGYTSSVRESYRRFLAVLSRPSDNGSLAQNPNMVTMGDAGPLLLRLLNVRYIVAAHELPAWDLPLDVEAACLRTRQLAPGEQLGAAVAPWAEGFNRVDVAVKSGGAVAVHVVERLGATEHLAYGELPAGDGPIRSLYFEPVADSAERPFYVYLDRPNGAADPAPEVCLDGVGAGSEAVPALGLGSRDAPYPLVFSANGLNVYLAPTSYGRAWLVAAAEAAPDFAAVLARLSRGQLDVAQTVLLEAPQLAAVQDRLGPIPAVDPAEVANTSPADAAGPPKTTPPQVHDEGPNQRRITLPPGATGWLVVSEAWDDGWRAEVDGRSTPVLRGDGGLITVPLGVDGAREVLLRYRPRSVLLGLVISLVGLAGVLGLLRPSPQPVGSSVGTSGASNQGSQTWPRGRRVAVGVKVGKVMPLLVGVTEAVSVAEATGVAVNSGVGVRLGVALNGGWVARSVGAGRAADGSQTNRRRSM
ncbi:MAG: hypothetical protein IPJ58_08285 [Ardenticatenia bacterium]|nr:hypothetical protein [Ardenticatenia bacterium]